MLTQIHSIAAKIKRRLLTPAAKIKQETPTSPLIQPTHLLLREWAAQTYLSGQGVEIGALHSPLKLPPQAHVQYVDRMPVPQLREQYPELKDLDLVEVNIVDDGEKLQTLVADSQDFLIANHFLEHCGDPIGTLKNFFRVVRPGGLLYIAVPDKRYTFDRDRPVTPLAHFFEDHQKGPEHSRRQHFEEYVRLVHKIEEPGTVERVVKDLMDRDYSIHYHVWTQREFLEFLQAIQRTLSFEIELFLKNSFEIIVVLRKVPADQSQHSTKAA